MEAAVDAVAAAKWGQGGLFIRDGGPVPFRREQVLQDDVPVLPDEVIEITQELCYYIYTIYGHFPAQLDTMSIGAYEPQGGECRL
jgi:hypothetical protein